MTASDWGAPAQAASSSSRSLTNCTASANAEAPRPKARLTANVAGNVEDRHLVFAQRAHHLEAFDRRRGRLQRLEASDRADQLLLVSLRLIWEADIRQPYGALTLFGW